MIIDFHTHLFPQKIRFNRQDYFSDEPAFKLLYQPARSKMAGAEEIIRTMDEQGVDISVVFGFPWKNEKIFQMHNDYILDAVARFPKRLIGFACFDMGSSKAAGEAQRCIESGLSGVGELAFYESGIDQKSLGLLSPVMELCRDKNLPVLIHTNEPIGHAYPGKTPVSLEQIYRLVKTFSGNKLILAHWGGGIFFYTLLKKEVKEALQNVYFDTAASPFLYDPEIYPVACKLAGKEKILLGTDFPLLLPDRYFRELESSGITPLEKTAVCGENAEKLLNLRLSTPECC